METFDGARLAVNTQTPLLRFVDGEPRQTTGGVVRMLVPLLTAWRESGRVKAVEWVAMAGDGEDHSTTYEGLDLSFVGVPEEGKKGYALVKEKMWELLNSNPSTPVPHGEGGVPEDAWVAFDAYQERCAERMLEVAHRMGGLDLLYVHDFQQLGVAEAWKGPRVPMLFHLHTPFPSALPGGWADYFVSRLRRYDAVIVSTRRYADNLREAGLDTPIHVVHPFIDPSSYHFASAAEVDAFRARFGIAPEDRILLHVGRMDPMKAQDRLLRAMPHVLREEPRARLVLVGNGSFSSSKRGGLGLDKGKAWRAECEALAAELGIQDRVTFTGHVDEQVIAAAYEACEAFALPSTREGFGLAAIEAWRHQKPVVVSDRAGVAEIVQDGVNGFVADCADAQTLADRLLWCLAEEDAARAMGRAGFATSRLATIEHGRQQLEAIIARLLQERAHVVA